MRYEVFYIQVYIPESIPMHTLTNPIYALVSYAHFQFDYIHGIVQLSVDQVALISLMEEVGTVINFT